MSLESPKNVRVVSSNSSSLTFSWDEVPCGSRGEGILHYDAELSMSPSNSVTSTTVLTQQTSGTTITMSELASGTSYSFRVAAVTLGERQYSKVLEAQTTNKSTYDFPNIVSIII